MSGPVSVGVIGVGSMGRHHARVYNELPAAEFVGVADKDEDVAAEVADRFETRVFGREDLLARCDAVSVAVPTAHHAPVATRAIEEGVAPLVEKPFVADLARGKQLAELADQREVPLQVGHIERFNPAVTALEAVRPEIDPIAVAARRQGPPVDRAGSDSTVMDLMIHDIDILLTIASSPVSSVTAVSAPDGPHITAQLQFEEGLIATLTASRITQEKIRDLAITAADCQVEVDYLDRDVRIHRQSVPEYLADDGDLRYRHESIIERPTIDNGEPLKAELTSFLEAVAEGRTPEVTAEDGLRAVELATRIEAVAAAADGETEHGVAWA